MNWDTYNTKGIKLKYVYRYISLEKLIHFLETGSLYFARMDTFEDNLENITPFDITELIGHLPNLDFLSYMDTSIMPDGEVEDMEKTRIKALKEVKKNLNSQRKKYVSSWALSNSESIGMWDLYAPNGFMIRFERSHLQRIIKSQLDYHSNVLFSSDLVIAGRVKYQDYETIPFNEKGSYMLYSAFRKHIAFKHEEEYRIVIQKAETYKKKGIEYYLGKIDKLDFEIYANPRMNKFAIDKYIMVLRKFSQNHVLKESRLKPWLKFKEMDIFKKTKT